MLRSSLLVTALSLFGSFLGLLVQVLMANRYGSGVVVDAYLYAISAPTFIAGMIASMLSYTVVPRVARAQGQPEGSGRLTVSLLAASFCIAAVFILSNPLLQRVQIAALPPTSPLQELLAQTDLLLLGWFIAGMQILNASLCAILTGLKRAFIATLLNLWPYVGMLVFMLATFGHGIEQLAFGLLFGTSVSFAVAFYLLRDKILRQWRQVRWEEVRTLVIRSPYTIIAMSCFSAYAVVDSYWGPRAGEGVLASLGYSQRIMIALGNLAVVGPSAILVPKFSELVVKGNREEFEQMLVQTLASTLGIGIVLAIVLYVGVEPLVKLLFMRGAFDQSDTLRVSNILRYCLPGMVFMLVSVIGLRILFCFTGVEKIAALLGLFWIVSYFLLSGLLVNLQGVGLAIAYSITWLVHCILLGALILQNEKKWRLGALLD